MNARTMLDAAIVAAEARVAAKQAQASDLAEDIRLEQGNLEDLRAARGALGPAAPIEQETTE